MSPERLADAVCDRIAACLPKTEDVVPLHEPTFQGREWEYVKECIDTGWVSSAGSYVEEFERRLADVTGAARAVAVVNGTAALHVALRLAGVEPEDEVLVPALSFVATANAVSYCGAVPHFVDSEVRTLGMDPTALEEHLERIAAVDDGECRNRETGRRIRACVPMHTFGHPVRLDPLGDVCQRYRLVMVEDATESLGSRYRGRHTGTRGRLSALSFNGNKVITTGGGGAILTDDGELADEARHLTTTAKVPHRWEYRHDRVGYNYRMPNLNAALGCAQIEQLPAFLDAKRSLARRYREAFSDLSGVTFVDEPEQARSNFWLNAILLPEDREDLRDRVLERTNDEGILARPAWTLMPELEMYAASPSSPLPAARSLRKRLVSLPSSVGLRGSPD